MGDVLVFPGKAVRGAEMATVIPRNLEQGGVSSGIVWFAGVPSSRELECLVYMLARGGRANLFEGPMVLAMYGDYQGITWTVLGWKGYPLSGRYLHQALVRILPGGSALATMPVGPWETISGLPLLRRLEVA